MADTLRDFAKNKGYTVEYDPKSKNVNLLNPANNQSINFKSGQGSEYGLGGLINGTNVIKDSSKLESSLLAPQQSTPMPEVGIPETNTNSDYIKQLLSNQVNTQPNLGIPTRQDISGTRSAQISDIYGKMQDSQLTQNKLAREQQSQGLQQGQYDVNLNYEQLQQQLDREKSQAQPQYQGLKSQQFKQALDDITAINETKANQGQYYGGANVQAQTTQRVANEQAINEINLQEQQLYDDINMRATMAYQQKENELKKINEDLSLLQQQGTEQDNALINQLQAQQAQAQLDLQSALDERDLQVSQLQQQAESERINTIQNLISVQENIAQNQQQNAFNLAGLTGSYVAPGQDTGIDTLQKQELDYAKEQEAKQYADNLAMQQAGLTGNYITPEQQLIIDNGVSLEDNQRITEIANNLPGGFQEYMNTLDETSPEYIKASVLRNQKLLQDPELQKQYGFTDIGTPTLQQQEFKTGTEQFEKQFDLQQQEFNLNKRATEENIKAKQIENKYLVKQIETGLTSQQLQNVGQDLSNQISKINIDYLPQEKKAQLESAKVQLQNGQLENAYQSIINANLPEQLSTEIESKIAGIENTYANISKTNIENELLTSEATGSGATEQNVINYASQYKGTDYVWGGNDLAKGVDCSGLTQQAFKKHGIDLPRTAFEQSKQGKSIKKENMLPGDLIFFDTVPGNEKDVDHVGIYLGNGKMLHASSSKGVIETDITTGYWQGRYTNSRRIINK